jgi:hypothetical protein
MALGTSARQLIERRIDRHRTRAMATAGVGYAK